MSSPALPLTAVAGALAFALAGCDLADDGPRTTQTRDVPAFTRLHNPDSVDVRMHVGEPQRVRVRAGQDVIDDVRTEVRDGTLRVTFDHDGFGGDGVTLEATVPALTAVTASGSGDVDAEGVGGERFALRSDGSGDVAVSGTTGRLELELDGSGDADLGELAAREATVTVEGSGDADVHVARRLEVTVDGSGDVRYRGNPALTKHDEGSGELRRAD